MARCSRFRPLTFMCRLAGKTILIILGLCILITLTQNMATANVIRLATTTSTENSGLLDHLLPVFEDEYGISVLVISVGTGQAIRMGKDGDVDVLLVHDRLTEDTFITRGFGSQRYDVMYNDFVVVGPSNDPAGIYGETNALEAFKKISEAGVDFISRGDDSGTHKAERRLWLGLSQTFPWMNSHASWYKEVGAGMGKSLNIAIGMDAYILVDRGTWIAFKNKSNHTTLVEGDKRLHNPYGVILINPNIHRHIKAKEARLFAEWLISSKAQSLIQSYTISGKQLFFPARK